MLKKADFNVFAFGTRRKLYQEKADFVHFAFGTGKGISPEEVIPQTCLRLVSDLVLVPWLPRQPGKNR